MNSTGMRYSGRRLAAILLGLTVSTASLADPEQPGRKVWYRYVDGSGQPTLSDQITETHIRLGYDMLDRNMLVIRRFPAFDAKLYQQDKAARDAAIARQKEDARILRLYSSASDAARARDRQLESIDTAMGYNRLQLLRLERLRANLVEDLAAQERKGEKPSERTRGEIARLDGQIADLRQLISAQKEELVAVKARFEPIVSRLQEMERPALAAERHAATPRW